MSTSSLDLTNYLAELQAHLKTGEAREHTYRPACERLFASVTNVQAANDQARTEHGMTDFVFRKASNVDVITGYAEAKDINVSLDKTEKTEQLERYAGYDNLILTNYIEFRFYKNGKRYAQVEIAKLNGLQLEPIPENFQILQDELENFLTQTPEVIKSGKRLAEIMGAKSRRIRVNIDKLLKLNSEDDTKAQEISKVYALMRELLVHDLTPDKFADMYAQTLVYGLFVARYNDASPESFSRSEARDLVPASNPFLREFFDHIAGPRFETRLAIIVDELCEVFEVSDVAGIINKHLKLSDSGQQDAKDPIIHFYEDFLSEYNPAERKKMGAYYTPLPVVQFMVRAVDQILKQDFNLTKGLADSSRETHDVFVQGKKAKQSYHKVQVLDPATGTATFLNEIIKFVHLKFKGQEGLWPSYARDNLVPRLSGFELMMGAYTIAHMKLGLTLKNLGVDDIGQRLGIYLTNSLEEGIPRQHDLFSFGLSEAVTHEAEEAAKIKSERPIMVVIGNPPYSGVSSNNTPYANSLVNKYKFEPGGLTKLKERNPKWINDDYVKFIAFAEDMIAKNGEGVLAYITNHGYLDNPTFRGMRWYLANTFDEIKIVDLHGNSKKKEVAPDGSVDQNVFDIQQGVAIILAVKKPGSSKNKKLAKVSVADIYGKRKDKFSILDKGDIKFKQIKLDEKMLYFSNKNTEGKEEYETGFSVADLFIVNSVGVVTAADGVLISNSPTDLKKQIDHIKNQSQDNKIGKRLRNHEFNEENITRVNYRPFDIRFIYYNPEVIERPRADTMKHFLAGDNLGLVVSRQCVGDWRYVFVTNKIGEFNLTGTAGRFGSGNFCPLWLYDEQGNKTSNLKPEIVEAIKLKVGEVSEQDIFDYIYGVLHWPAYREKYKEFLKIDFPRVPYPASQKEFEHFRAAGQRLRELHLMKATDVDDFITTYPQPGDNVVTKLKYQPDSPLEGCPQGGVVINQKPIKLKPAENLPYNASLKDLAKQNRKAGVLSEVIFWQQVNKSKFHSLDFDRQKIIGNYIVDFFAQDLSLVIEIDGESHNDKGDYDEERQKYLESLGLKVFRASDLDVKKDIGSVMSGLEEFIIEGWGSGEPGATTPPLQGTPQRGESTTASVDDTRLNLQTGRVYINDTQYFGGVPEQAWNFYIGGYQPAQKWLKDRKGRELSSEDIEHYQRIIKVLVETGKVMEGV